MVIALHACMRAAVTWDLPSLVFFLLLQLAGGWVRFVDTYLEVDVFFYAPSTSRWISTILQ
jgi:hypothetical protein